MYYYYHPKSELTSAQLGEFADRFERLQSPEELAALLKKDLRTVQQLAENPSYYTFYIPKPGGQKRFIQNPNPALKAVQTELNRYLQAVYHRIKPDCAHGFVLSPVDEAQPRNIYTNALAHARGHWFLNVDLQDFFHTVTEKHLHILFRYTFGFTEHLTTMLACLCLCNGRLPMGAPTSPVLSNLVFYFTDHQLTELAQRHEGVYTRYADDLTFSFPRPPADEFLDQVRMLLLKQSFVVNEKKLRLQGRLEAPEITGLCVGKGSRPTLSKSYLKTLKKEIAIYRWLVSETVQKRGLFQTWLFDQFRKSLRGQLEFAGFVMGKNDRTYQKLMSRLLWE